MNRPTPTKRRRGNNRFTPEQLASIRKLYLEGDGKSGPMSSNQVAHYLKREFGIEVTDRGVVWLLKEKCRVTLRPWRPFIKTPEKRKGQRGGVLAPAKRSRFAFGSVHRQ